MQGEPISRAEGAAVAGAMDGGHACIVCLHADQGALEAHGADDDMRNHALFTLRVKLRCINESKNIDRIERHVLAAEEAFEMFWDEVAGE